MAWTKNSARTQNYGIKVDMKLKETITCKYRTWNENEEMVNMKRKWWFWNGKKTKQGSAERSEGPWLLTQQKYLQPHSTFHCKIYFGVKYSSILLHFQIQQWSNDCFLFFLGLDLEIGCMARDLSFEKD